MGSHRDPDAYVAALERYVADQPVRLFGKAVEALHQPHPVLLLAPDATIRAANQFAAWLWGRILDDRAAGEACGGASTLLGQSALTVLRDNLDRVALVENHEFARAVLAQVERLTSLYKRVRREAHALVAGLLDNQPALVSSYEDTRPDPEHVFAYSFTIRAPAGPTDTVLRLRTTVDWVQAAGGRGPGMLVQYRPAADSPKTAKRLRHAREEIATALPGVSAVAPANIDTLDERLLLESDPTGVSPLRRAVMESPSVVLYLDQSDASRAALYAFKVAGQDFQPQFAPANAGAPWVDFGGERFRGLEHIREFVSALGRFDASFLASLERMMPEHGEGRDHAVQRFQERLQAEHLLKAQAIVDGRTAEA